MSVCLGLAKLDTRLDKCHGQICTVAPGQQDRLSAKPTTGDPLVFATSWAFTARVRAVFLSDPCSKLGIDRA